MKNIIIALTIMAFSTSCKAQSPVIHLYNNSNYGDLAGAYYKDIDNFQDQFVGTWLYTNGTSSLKVIFKKKPMFHDTVGSVAYYEDFLVGEYQYIENGVEKTNSLNLLNNDYDNIYKYNLCSHHIIKYTSNPKCTDCLPSTQRLVFGFNEPSRRFGEPNLIESRGPRANFIIRKVVENGAIKIKVQFVNTEPAFNAPNEALENFSLPYGDYVLIKQ